MNERPRERLIRNSVNNLSNEDLLAIILATGTKEYSVKTLANLLLSEIKDIKNLNNVTYNNLIKIKGIGKCKACQILALVELAKRINYSNDSLVDLKFDSTKTIYNYFKDKFKDVKQEHFYCLYLDNNFKIIKEKLLFIGTVNQSLVHPREIFKEAYLLSSSYIICIHNHPTGNIKPSLKDKELTKRLLECSKILGIRIVDHLIIGKNSYYSFFENGEV